MSCKSAVYANNSDNQNLLVDSVISFGNIVRKFGNNCNMSGGNLTLKGSGYYDIDTNISATANASGTSTITLYKDGTLISGATQSITVESGDLYSFSIPTTVRNLCCYESTITAIITGVALTVTNASVVAKKI